MPHAETITEGGVTRDVLTDEALNLRVEISRKGAEMISLQRRDASGAWRGFLYRDGETSEPASGWGNHATVMGYFLHRLWQEKSLYRGIPIHGGNHGFIRHFDFDAPLAGQGTLTYSVPVDRVPPEAYPLKVSLDVTYRLDERGVTVEFAFANHEPELTAHVGFGIHPGFAITSLESAELLLPAGTYTRYMAPGNFLDGRTEIIHHAGGASPFPREHLVDSYIFSFEADSSRQLILNDPPGGRRLKLDFSDVPYVTLWSDGHPFFCVEPCWGLPDSNPPTAFENKPGIQTIPAGGSLRRTFTIDPGFL